MRRTSAVPAPEGLLTLLGLVIVLSGCDDITDPSIPGVRETWRPQHDTRVLAGTVRVDTLTIEAGTTICGGPGAILLVSDRLDVNGSADRPVLFTACDAAQGWGGIRVSPEYDSDGSGHLSHVRIEYADTGIYGWNLEIENATIRQTRGPGIAGEANVTATTVDSACAAWDGSCAAVRADRYAPMNLTDVIVRGSGDMGVARNRRAPITLGDVTIEGSAGVGLSLGGYIFHNDIDNFLVEGSLRITGNLYPASVAAHDIPALLPTPEAYERLLGNERDTLLVGLNLATEGLTVRPGLPWRVYDGVVTGSNYVPLGMTLEPGATLAAVDTSTRLTLAPGQRIEGTAERPITFIGLTLRVVGDTPDTTRLRHVRFEHGAMLSTTYSQPFPDPAATPVVLEDVELHDARIELGSAGSRIDGLSADGGGENAAIGAAPVLRLTGSGIVAQDIFTQDAPQVGIELSGDDIVLSRCQVSGSPEDGIRVLDGAGIRIRDCNFQGNAGAGVNNLGADPVDAIDNWWGDAAGPAGPDGDGVAGAVQFDPWLTAPVVFPGASS